MEYFTKKGEIFNCEIKSLEPKGKGEFIISFRITQIEELNELIFSTHINSNWTLSEVLSYYKYQNNEFQVEFDGVDLVNQKPLWILRKVN